MCGAVGLGGKNKSHKKSFKKTNKKVCYGQKSFRFQRCVVPCRTKVGCVHACC